MSDDLTQQVLDKYLEVARRDDCFKILVPSDVRRLLGEIARLRAEIEKMRAERDGAFERAAKIADKAAMMFDGKPVSRAIADEIRALRAQDGGR